MKIVVIGTRGIPNIQGGVETHCEELYPLLVNNGLDITVIRRHSYVTLDNKITEFKGVKLNDIYAPRKKSIETIIHTFIAIIKAKKLKADIVHIHAIGPALLTPFARILGMKVVFTHHGPDYDRDKWSKSAKTILKIGERMGCKFANEVIVISEVINNIIKEKYNQNNANLIYNGVPDPHIIDSTNYLNELGVEFQKYVFSMGRFVPEKNFHHLIKAFASLKEKEYKLIIAGDADFEDTYSKGLKKLAKENDVILTGFIKGDKLHELLTHAKVFVLPSSHEGLPIALLEAMSYKLPVIVSNIPANLEIGLDPSCYFYVGNDKELADKIADIFNNGEKQISYNMENYHWNKIAEQTMNIYKKLQKENTKLFTTSKS